MIAGEHPDFDASQSILASLRFCLLQQTDRAKRGGQMITPGNHGKTVDQSRSKKMKTAGWLIRAVTVTSALVAGPACAQDLGYPAQGLVLAQQVCSQCHAIDRSQATSPNAAAPRFEAIANTPGMTALALMAALQTSHETMPNIILEPSELRNVVAYILSLAKR